MANNTDLFDLIKSMTTAEKSYFKRYGYKQQSNPDKEIKNSPYMKLFDAIDKQEEYNEERLFKQFSNEKFVKNFSATKNYLFSIVLDSMLACNEGKSGVDQLLQQVREINQLYQKRLYSLCLKKIEPAKKRAEFYEYWDIGCHLLYLQLKCMQELPDFGETYSDMLLNQVKHHLSLLQHTWEVNELFMIWGQKWAKMGVLGRSDGQMEEYHKFIQHETLSNIQNVRTIRTKIIYYLLHFFYAVFQNNARNAYSIIKEAIIFCESNSLVQQEIPEIYLQFIEYEFGVLRALQLWADLEKCAEKMNVFLEEQGKRLDTKLVESYQNKVIANRFFVYNKTWNFDTCLELVPKIKEKHFTDTKTHSVILFGFARIYFMLDRFSDALQYINESLAIKEEDHSADYYVALRILNLLVHFELGNEQLLDYALRSTYRFLSNRQRLFEVERLFLRFIKKVIDSPNHKQTNELYRELYEAISITVKANPKEQIALQILNLQFWLESKINKIPMSQLVGVYKTRYEQEQTQYQSSH